MENGMHQFVDLKAQYARLKEEINRNIQQVLDGGQYVLGPAVTNCESELAQFCGSKHAVGVSSGTDALFIPLLSLGLTPKDAVFVPSFTYTATAEAILLANATPVFVDVDENSFNIDVAHLQKKISDVKSAGTLVPKVILPVDLFGQPADYSSINRIAKQENMFVLADAAQAYGGAQDDKRIGTLTHCTATSFYPSKPLGCYGDGGAILTDDDDLAGRLKSIRSHGKGKDKYDVVRIGINGRLDSIQAAVISAKLTVFEDELDARERVARIYDERLGDQVATPWRVPGARSAWAQYTIKVDNRETLRQSLSEDGVPTMVFYPKPMHLQPAYFEYGDGPESLPVSERLSEQVMSLPMHPYMSDDVAHAICDVISKHLKTAR